jgi:hypothetical protein
VKESLEVIQRISKAILEGKTCAIDFDLRSYFDTVRHHIVLHKMARERRFCLPPLEDGRSRSHFTICHPGPCGSCKTTDLRYSWRSAVTGLMRMARIAGTQQATAAIARIIRNTVAYVIGSVGWTPYKICCNSRPTRRARPSPIAVPEPMRSSARRGSVASFGLEQGFKERASFPGTLGSHFEEFVDEPILTPDATPAQPPHLALPNYVHRLIALNRSSRSLSAGACRSCNTTLHLSDDAWSHDQPWPQQHEV